MLAAETSSSCYLLRLSTSKTHRDLPPQPLVDNTLTRWCEGQGPQCCCSCRECVRRPCCAGLSARQAAADPAADLGHDVVGVAQAEVLEVRNLEGAPGAQHSTMHTGFMRGLQPCSMSALLES
jgi:hypothetical protein